MLSTKDLQIQEYDDALTARIIEKITVRSRNEIEIRFTGDYKKDRYTEMKARDVLPIHKTFGVGNKSVNVTAKYSPYNCSARTQVKRLKSEQENRFLFQMIPFA